MFFDHGFTSVKLKTEIIVIQIYIKQVQCIVIIETFKTLQP